MRIRWTEHAESDLAAIGRFIEYRSPGAAWAYIGKITAQVETLSETPRTGRTVPEIGDPMVRELILRNYRIVYQIVEEEVRILTVFEGHKLLELPDTTDIDPF